MTRSTISVGINRVGSMIKRTQKGKTLFAQVEPVDDTEDEREALEEQLLDIKPSQNPTA
jgi:head-tail adaptor